MLVWRECVLVLRVCQREGCVCCVCVALDGVGEVELLGRQGLREHGVEGALHERRERHCMGGSILVGKKGGNVGGSVDSRGLRMLQRLGWCWCCGGCPPQMKGGGSVAGEVRVELVLVVIVFD